MSETPLIPYERADWMSRGACVGVKPDLFFPQRGESTASAKAFCAACPIRQRCLDYALEHSIKHGIWGGKSERERRGMRRARAVAA